MLGPSTFWCIAQALLGSPTLACTQLAEVQAKVDDPGTGLAAVQQKVGDASTSLAAMVETQIAEL